MPSLDTNKSSNYYIVSMQDNFSFKFLLGEIDNVIKSGLAMKKSILFIKQGGDNPVIKNEECLDNNDNFLFIPHRLKKQFNSLNEYLK